MLKKNTRWHNLVFILPVLWIFLVFYSWFADYAQVFRNIFSLSFGWSGFFNNTQPFILPVFAFSLFWIYLFIVKKITVLNLRLSYFFMLIVAFIFLTVIFNIASFSRVMLPGLFPYLDSANWITYNVAFFYKISQLILWLSAFSLAIFLLGKKIARYLKLALILKNALLKNLVIFSFGLSGWLVIFFLLALCKIFSIGSLLFISTILLFWERKKVFYIIKNLFSFHSIHINLGSPALPFAIMTVFIFSYHIINSIQHIPLGFDSSTEYLNRAHLLADYHHLLPGNTPFAYSLIGASGYLFSTSASLAVSLNIFYAILGYLTIYSFASLVFSLSRKYSLVAATTWLVMPITSDLLSVDPKVELLLFFFSALSLLLFFLWNINRIEKNLLYASFFMLGMAFTVKITAIFLLIPLFLYLFFSLFSKINERRPTFQTLVLAAFFLILPILPWTPTIFQGQLATISKSILTGKYEQLSKTEETTLSRAGVDASHCSFTGYAEDINRFKPSTHFSNQERVSSFLQDTQLAKQTLMEIGFLYFSLLPIFFLYLFKKMLIEKEKNPLCLFSFLTLTYWSLWMLFGKNMIWYAFPGFLFLVIFLALFLKYFQKNRFVYYSIFLAIFISTLIYTLIFTAKMLDYSNLQEIAKSSHFAENLYLPLLEEINSSDKKILVTATPLIYQIKNNDQRLIKDYYLDIFHCLHLEKNSALTLKRLQKLDIGFIIYNRKISHGSQDTRQAKAREFEDFAEKNLTLIHKNSDESYLVFKID